jgi:hypothetical protein
MKPEPVFGLENAAWPVFLIGASSEVLLANAAAKNIFGAVLNVKSPSLSVLWAAENGISPGGLSVTL